MVISDGTMRPLAATSTDVGSIVVAKVSSCPMDGPFVGLNAVRRGNILVAINGVELTASPTSSVVWTALDDATTTASDAHPSILLFARHDYADASAALSSTRSPPGQSLEQRAWQETTWYCSDRGQLFAAPMLEDLRSWFPEKVVAAVPSIQAFLACMETQALGTSQHLIDQVVNATMDRLWHHLCDIVFGEALERELHLPQLPSHFNLRENARHMLYDIRVVAPAPWSFEVRWQPRGGLPAVSLLSKSVSRGIVVVHSSMHPHVTVGDVLLGINRQFLPSALQAVQTHWLHASSKASLVRPTTFQFLRHSHNLVASSLNKSTRCWQVPWTVWDEPGGLTSIESYVQSRLPLRVDKLATLWAESSELWEHHKTPSITCYRHIPTQRVYCDHPMHIVSQPLVLQTHSRLRWTCRKVTRPRRVHRMIMEATARVEAAMADAVLDASLDVVMAQVVGPGTVEFSESFVDQTLASVLASLGRDLELSFVKNIGRFRHFHRHHEPPAVDMAEMVSKRGDALDSTSQRVSVLQSPPVLRAVAKVEPIVVFGTLSTAEKISSVAHLEFSFWTLLDTIERTSEASTDNEDSITTITGQDYHAASQPQNENAPTQQQDLPETSRRPPDETQFDPLDATEEDVVLIDDANGLLSITVEAEPLPSGLAPSHDIVTTTEDNSTTPELTSANEEVLDSPAAAPTPSMGPQLVDQAQTCQVDTAALAQSTPPLAGYNDGIVPGFVALGTITSQRLERGESAVPVVDVPVTVDMDYWELLNDDTPVECVDTNNPSQRSLSTVVDEAPYSTYMDDWPPDLSTPLPHNLKATRCEDQRLSSQSDASLASMKEWTDSDTQTDVTCSDALHDVETETLSHCVADGVSQTDEIKGVVMVDEQLQTDNTTLLVAAATQTSARSTMLDNQDIQEEPSLAGGTTEPSSPSTLPSETTTARDTEVTFPPLLGPTFSTPSDMVLEPEFPRQFDSSSTESSQVSDNVMAPEVGLAATGPVEAVMEFPVENLESSDLLTTETKDSEDEPPDQLASGVALELPPTTLATNFTKEKCPGDPSDQRIHVGDILEPHVDATSWATEDMPPRATDNSDARLNPQHGSSSDPSPTLGEGTPLATARAIISSPDTSTPTESFIQQVANIHAIDHVNLQVAVDNENQGGGGSMYKDAVTMKSLEGQEATECKTSTHELDGNATMTREFPATEQPMAKDCAASTNSALSPLVEPIPHLDSYDTSPPLAINKPDSDCSTGQASAHKGSQAEAIASYQSREQRQTSPRVIIHEDNQTVRKLPMVPLLEALQLSPEWMVETKSLAATRWALPRLRLERINVTRKKQPTQRRQQQATAAARRIQAVVRAFLAQKKRRSSQLYDVQHRLGIREVLDMERCGPRHKITSTNKWLPRGLMKKEEENRPTKLPVLLLPKSCKSSSAWPEQSTTDDDDDGVTGFTQREKQLADELRDLNAILERKTLQKQRNMQSLPLLPVPASVPRVFMGKRKGKR
ncbi:hypothetical protein, variant [Aphanomyces astaci]|nr:hypothetical protein, variant [Aphanomyces astaci]ETV79811.1 hypothetical protein, variant [Aphanomyces astaci]|eukprot:XP_009830747.1 hypothetical protein, variant [Aphanomyces astaci]